MNYYYRIMLDTYKNSIIDHYNQMDAVLDKLKQLNDKAIEASLNTNQLMLLYWDKRINFLHSEFQKYKNSL